MVVYFIQCYSNLSHNAHGLSIEIDKRKSIQTALTSMIKSKIKTLITFILRCTHILFLLFNCHGVPYTISFQVAIYVVYLYPDKQWHQRHSNDENLRVASTVSRPVVLSVDISGSNGPKLYCHVVQS